MIRLIFIGLTAALLVCASREEIKAQKAEAENMNHGSEPRLLLKDSLTTDIRLLERALTEMHPGLYRYNSENETALIFQDLRSNLPEKIAENEFMIRLAQAVRKIKCGHTYLNPWNLNAQVRNRLFGGQTYFPIGFKIIDGRFFSTENATDNNQIERGAEILAVNGVSITEIYEKLKSIAKTDGNNNVSVDSYLSLWDYRERNYHAFDLYLQLFYPLEGDTFKIDFKNYKKDVIQSIKAPAMTKAARAEKMREKYTDDNLGQKKWEFGLISKDIALIRLGTFAIWNWKDFDQKTWFSNVFGQLDTLGVKKLAIDIRGNGGGLSEPANELISYLTEDTLRCDNLGKVYIRTTKFDSELLPHIDSWVEVLKTTGLPKQLYKEAENGLYEFFEPSGCKDIIPKEKRFKGEVFIFGGATNVSATFTLLQKAKRFGFATYIGDESGGNKQGINGGEYAFFTLPYSKFEVDIPLKFFAPYSPEEDSGIKPQVQIDFTRDDLANETDPFLEYISK